MTADHRPRPARPRHLWVVAVLALIWTGFGAFDYLATQLELDFYMNAFTAEQREYFTSFPAWTVAFWALGVWGAFVGSVGLLMGRVWAVWAYAISILGLFVTTIYNFLLSDGIEMMGTAGVVMTVVIWLIAMALLWYAARQKRNGVLH